MKPKTTGDRERTQRLKHVQGEGPNWLLIAGGALLSTLSIRIGCRLKQAFDAKRSSSVQNSSKENVKFVTQRMLGTCKSHSNLCCYTQEEDECDHCLSGNLNIESTQNAPPSPVPRDGGHSLLVVKIPITAAESIKDGDGALWTSSPERLELPHKPFHRPGSSDSLSISESGSDIYSKREVIQKLRQQLKRRDEMIIEMQAQITDLRNSLTFQTTRSAHLQSQLDSANQDLFDSEREIQRLRKAIADHCVAEAVNGGSNGYLNSTDDEERGAGEDKIGMLKREVGELKELIEGKEFLLQSYKEEKVELSTKVKELQLKLNTQVQNIL